jgi:hypothetical protein
MRGEDKKGEKKVVMRFLTAQDVREIMKVEMEKEREEKESKKIICWVCGREGTMYISLVKRFPYVYCIHTEKERCYLGRADKILTYLILGIKREEQKQEQGIQEEEKRIRKKRGRRKK